MLGIKLDKLFLRRLQLITSPTAIRRGHQAAEKFVEHLLPELGISLNLAREGHRVNYMAVGAAYEPLPKPKEIRIPF